MFNSSDLSLSSYDYHLPPDLVADRPIEGRDRSKLMVYCRRSDKVEHTSFQELHHYLPSNSLLVLNQSKVVPCRLFGQKHTGGKAEWLLINLVPKIVQNKNLYSAMIKTNGRKRAGELFVFDHSLQGKIETVLENGTFVVSFNLQHEQLIEYLNLYAQLPLPPYIRGGVADSKDKEDYQTLYANGHHQGSVAAPTAGLHFTPQVFDSLANKNIDRAFVTLHVGAGTFLPVKTANIEQHQMHYERFSVDRSNLEKIRSALQNQQQNIIAVGTTSLRVLESYYQKDPQLEYKDEGFETNLFLYPGKTIHVANGLITNFHLPKSTLIMLVSSLLGRQKTLELYELAVREKYRFFSYGDAMLII